LIFPSRADIVWLNRILIRNTKGMFVEPENLLNAGSLEWVLEAMRYPLFGVDKYPTIAEKAALLAWTIIKNHIFWDGNKRTGMAALEIFLESNGHHLNATNNEMEDVALRIASGYIDNGHSIGSLVQWVRERLEPKDTDIS
jgi:death-on-curing family protein